MIYICCLRRGGDRRDLFTQRRLCQHLAEKEGLTVAEEYVDTRSSRPALLGLAKVLAHRPDLDAVIAVALPALDLESFAGQQFGLALSLTGIPLLTKAPGGRSARLQVRIGNVKLPVGRPHTALTPAA